MTKGRMEAFSDGVLAIIITIMVLEMKVPHGSQWSDLRPILPVFISYLLSFINVGIYWNNHHHMLHAAHKISGTVLWTNTHLLFWLSLFPFVTGWMGENNFTTHPVALYGVISLMAGFAYFFLTRSLTDLHGRNSEFARALGSDTKEKLSLVIYALGVGLSFLQPLVSLGLYFVVAVMWFVPDRRFEANESSQG